MTTSVNESRDHWCSLLANQVVFLTGAAGWIARHIALTCYDHGARVVLADLDVESITKVKDDLFPTENTDERIFVVHVDVTKEETIAHAVQLTLEKWKTIDILINAAAIFTLGYVEDVSAADWSRLLDVNVRGYALLAKEIVPILKEKRSGSIVNISSAAGLVAHSNFLPYSTSKGALLQMTRNLALDLGPFNIRVNSISPGAIDSPTLYRTAEQGGVTKEQFDEEHAGKCLQRLGHPQEVANAVIFLLSDLCSFITGSNMVIDGGYTTV